MGAGQSRERGRWMLSLFVPALIGLLGSGAGSMAMTWYALGGTVSEHGVQLMALEARQATSDAQMRRELDALSRQFRQYETTTEDKLQAIDGKMDQMMFYLMQHPQGRLDSRGR